MTQRDTAIHAFLDRAGWAGATRMNLAGDASNRRYERLNHPQLGLAVLMDAPPEKGEDVRPFVSVTDRLRGLSLSAPRILAEDEAQGFLLLEDLGDTLFARRLQAAPMDEPLLYAAAVDLLAYLHGQADAARGLAPYDLATCQREAALLPDWYLAAAPGAPDRATRMAELLGDAITGLAPAGSPVLVLRDYHAENLLWLPERSGHKRVGLLDYQDALAGHPAYDLVSLLEDARRDTSDALQAEMLARYIDATGITDADFRWAYAVMGAQRNIKILGIFARLWLRDGKPQYLDLLPRVWAHLMRDLQHPALSDLRLWVEDEVPPPDRAYRAALRAADGGR